MKPETLKLKLARIDTEILSLYDNVDEDIYGLDFIDAIVNVSNPMSELREKLDDLITKQEVI